MRLCSIVFGIVRCLFNNRSKFVQCGVRWCQDQPRAMKKDLEDILESLPPQPPRSRLDPYAELIEEMRRRNWTYRGIAQVLAEKCNVKVSPSNIYHFVNLRKPHVANDQQTDTRGAAPGVERETHLRDLNVTSRPTRVAKRQDNEVRERIDALKRRPAVRVHDPRAFEFDPAEPLRLKKPL